MPDTTNWKAFWQDYRIIDVKDNQDRLFQVGKTVGGKVIESAVYDDLIESVVQGLSLGKEDRLLDLCCGNGVMADSLATYAGAVLGVDFSVPYIESANELRSTENQFFVMEDVLKVDRKFVEEYGGLMDKVLLYDCLAYFDSESINTLAANLYELLNPGGKVFVGSILDRSRIWDFFNTPGRKWNYYFNIKFRGKSQGLGIWWTPSGISALFEKHGFKVILLPQPQSLHTAHYRLDLVLEKV